MRSTKTCASSGRSSKVMSACRKLSGGAGLGAHIDTARSVTFPSLSTFGLELADGGCPLRVLGEAEVELSDAPGTHAAPVDLAGHPLQISARDAADNPLVRSQVAETVDEPGLVLAQPAGEIRRRDALRFEAFEDPWQEDEVAESRLDGGGAWAEHVREGVAHRTQTQHVEGPGLFQAAKQRAHSLAGVCI